MGILRRILLVVQQPIKNNNIQSKLNFKTTYFTFVKLLDEL